VRSEKRHSLRFITNSLSSHFCRYLDAAKIRDQIFDWELKFFLWRIEEKKDLQKRFESVDGINNRNEATS